MSCPEKILNILSDTTDASSDSEKDEKTAMMGST